MDEVETLKTLTHMIDTARNQFGDDWVNNNISAISSGYYSPEYLYEPSEALLKRIDDYERWCTKKESKKKKEDEGEEDAGQLMEEIALLSLTCLKGYNSVKSFQSYAAQIDLTISGDSVVWKALMAHIRIDWLHRTIVVEAKNYDDKIDDAIFTRLCYIIENYFRDTSSLGIFYTRKGATGFPARAQSDEEQRRKRSLTYAQATQIIFYARTNKRIIVFDHDDIISLRNPGSLPKMLELKIKSIGEWTGMPDANVENVQVIDLPPHLARHMHGGTDA